jgi:hypothetical protein
MTFDPTDEQRRTVKAMSGFGVPQPDIAIHIGIDPKTLRTHFREELDRGAIEATTKVAQSLFNMATQGNNVAAAIFWMKARAGWREKNQVELTGPDGGPMLHIALEDGRPTVEEMMRQALMEVSGTRVLGTGT